jgi:hypothetical protein
VARNILAAATKNGDQARALRAQAALTEISSHSSRARPTSSTARALAALEHGDITTAKREAEGLLGADPGNGDALVIALAAADLEQDHAAFNALLERSLEPGTPASPEVLATLSALLSRRVSAQAAQLLKPVP